jgi:hypothetical protein
MSSSEPFPIGLSQDQKESLARIVATIVPPDRDMFVRDVGRRMRGQMVGDGTLGRALRDALDTNLYRRSALIAVGGKGRPRGSVDGRHGYSRLASGAGER